jgi:hypothetical protein
LLIKRRRGKFDLLLASRKAVAGGRREPVDMVQAAQKMLRNATFPGGSKLFKF